jgi:flavin-dependent dehydrogenase
MSEGVRIDLSTNAVSASKEKDLWSVKTNKGYFWARSVILAAGPVSHLNGNFGLSSNDSPMKGIGAKIKRKDDSNAMDFYVESDLKGGYGWYFPRGSEVNIGIVSRTDQRKWFEWFLKKIGVREKEIISWHGGVIPDQGPVKKFVGDSAIAVGDSGGFCHPVSKGGIYCALLTGREGAAAIVDHLSGDGSALQRFDRFLRSHSGFSEMNIKRRDFLADMDDPTLNGITSIMKGRDVQTVNKKVLALEALKHPSLYPFLKRGFSFVRTNRDWIQYTF